MEPEKHDTKQYLCTFSDLIPWFKVIVIMLYIIFLFYAIPFEILPNIWR